jgi:hypothetical protein
VRVGRDSRLAAHAPGRAVLGIVGPQTGPRGYLGDRDQGHRRRSFQDAHRSADRARLTVVRDVEVRFAEHDGKYLAYEVFWNRAD